MKVLTAAGFDNAIAISDIDETDIINIESYAGEHCRHLIDLDSVDGKLKLKPGHRKLVLALSKKAASFLQHKSQKIEQTNTVLCETVEILTNEEVIELGKNLIDKLNKCLTACNIKNIQYTSEEIGDIEAYISHSRFGAKHPSYKCAVKCVFCEKRVPCTHNKHWQSSNLERHLKKEAEKKIVEKTTELSSSSTSNHNKNQLNDSDLDEVLELNSK